MVITVKDHVAQCYSAADGAVIANILREPFAQGEKVVLSFASITDVTSSFVNASIVSFLATYSSDWIKSHIAIRDVTVQVADLIRRCLANGEKNASAA